MDYSDFEDNFDILDDCADDDEPFTKRPKHDFMIADYLLDENVAVHFKEKCSEACENDEKVEGTSRWAIMFKALMDFQSEKGHCNVPINCESIQPDGRVLMLGTWLSTQRQLYRKGKLRSDRQLKLQKLADLGKFQWVMPSIASHDDEKWNSTFELLKRYGEIHGHYHVPSTYECQRPDGKIIKLGKWLCKQREQKRTGGIRPDREALLQSLEDSVTSIRADSLCTSIDDDDWRMMFDYLFDYGVTRGDFHVPLNYHCELPDGTSIKLGIWLSLQKQLMSKGSLRPDREAELQALVDKGYLKWESPSACLSEGSKWKFMFDILLYYGKEQPNGDCNVPSNYDYHVGDGTVIKLGAWLSQQRHLKKKGKLLPEREEQLQQLVESGRLRWGRAGNE